MSFGLTNCRKCGKLYHKVDRTPICPDCAKKLEDKFQKVKEYIQEHEEANVISVSREMDVSVEQIKKWVREERLFFADAASAGIECLMCGVPIAQGKYCAKCKEEMANRLDSAYQKAPGGEQKKNHHDGSRMRFLDKT